MKIIIMYATKYGTTRTCAELLSKCLKNQDVTLMHIGKGGQKIPDISDYDIVVFGSNVRMNKIDGELSEYLKKNKDMLIKRKCAYFLCCGFTDCFEDYLYKNIPEELIESSLSVSCFGGRIDPSAARGMDKLILSAVRSNILGGGQNGQGREDISLPTVMENNISQFADRILGK